ncbi:MAG TPA: CHASE2 domain-containing protein [Vicinamibacterales bacterium]|jgi:adenylate cyclase
MTVRPYSFVLLCGLIPTVVVAALCLSRPSLFSGFEYGAYDRLLRAAPVRPPSGQVVIVDIDDRSLASIGQWPWRRELIGQLVERLRNLGASMVALDIIFAEADRYDASGTSSDETLAHALSAGRVVLGYALTFDARPGQAGACEPQPFGVAVVQGKEGPVDDPFFRATGAICSLPVLSRAAGASGFLNAAPDPDGRLRRAPLLMSSNGQVVPSLALAAVVAADQSRDAVLRVINVNASMLQLGDRSVPLDGKSNLLLRYRGPKRTFSYISAAQVLSGEATPDMFKDKVVFVGTTALGTREVVTTPIDALFAGVEVQATVADDLLQRDFLHAPDSRTLIEAVTVLGAGGIVTLLVGAMGLAWGGAGLVAVVVAVWVSAFRLMSGGTFLSPVYPTIGVVAAYAAMAVAHLLLERRRADREGHDRAISQRLMVQGMLSLTEVRHAETGRHSRRTRHYARVIAEQLARHEGFGDYLTPDRIAMLAGLAPLHDIGKVGVPDRLLNKPGALTEEELSEMRKHPEHGRDVILHAEQDVGVPDDVLLAMAKDIVYTHHEKWDGTGYPRGLSGRAIPLVGRLIALVDVYDAITTRRTYREPMSHEDAVAFIAGGRGTHFDPTIVDAFLEVAPTLGRLMAESESTAAASTDTALP